MVGRNHPAAAALTRRRRLLLGLTGLTVLFLAAAGLSRAAVAVPAQTSVARVQALAAGLKCLTCQGESVAESRAPIASGMRETIRDQVEAGWNDERIRSWFVARYGSAVLLTPPRSGLAAALWVAPQLFIVAGAGLLAARRRRAREPLPARVRAAGLGGTGLLAACSALAVIGAGTATGVSIGRGAQSTSVRADAVQAETLRARAAEHPADPQAWLALGRELEQGDQLSAAIEAYERAARLSPQDSSIAVRLAFAYLKADRAVQARPLLDQILTRQPSHPEALLLLGTLQRSAGEPQARETLRRFLEVAADHPAAPQVRRMLSEGG